jgi:3-phenylpropionate/trans-cinnamate dioxygenase ferredoxin component
LETSFIRVASKNEIPNGKMKKLQLDNKEILIANVKGSFYAIDSKCTHQGTDLSQGKLGGNILECPKHHAKFDVTTGKVVSKPSVALMHPSINDEKTYQVRIEKEDIMVKP